MLKRLIKKSLATLGIIWMSFFGIDPTTIVEMVYHRATLLENKNIVDKLYLASKNPNVVDEYFSQKKAHAAVASGEREYVIDIGPVTGSASANYVYAAFFNPASSGRTASIKRIAVRSNTLVGTNSNYVNLTVRRISSSSAGTQITASNFPQKNNGSLSSVMEIRQAGVTVAFSGTADSRILGQPLSGAAGSYYSNRDITFDQDAEKLIVQQGEGIAIYQEAAGSANSRISVLIEWEESTNPPSPGSEFLFAFPRVEANAGANYVFNSFFNPSGSGKTAVVKRIWFGAETCDTNAVYANNLVLQRIRTASAGTQIAATNIPKKHASSTNSVMEFRHTNVTVTTVAGTDARLGVATPCAAAAEPHGWAKIDFHPSDERLILQPGEGIALFTDANGDPDQLVRMIIEWDEVTTGDTPSAQDEYIWSSARIESASAANTTFYSFYNPVNSGKTATVKRLVVRINSDNAANYAGFAWRRLTATSTGGTQINVNSLPKKHTGSATSSMDIRWCGAACGSAITATYFGTTDSNFLMVHGAGAVGQTIGDRELVLGDNEKIILQPGEGIGLYNDALADTDQYIKVGIEWGEEASSPSSEGEYLIDFSIAGNTGNPYTYATFFNPSGSGQNAIIRRVSLRVDTAGAAVYIPLQIRRISAASLGTQITAANIPKKHTSTSNSAMQIRRTGVTATYIGSTDSKMLAIQTPGAVASAVSGNTGYLETEFTNREYIILKPGEGIGLYQDSAGNANFRVKLQIEWDEEASSPAESNEYFMTVGPITQSTAQGYVYATLFNPVGSLKNYIVKQIGILSDRNGTVVAPSNNPLAIRRITAASGGTLVTATDIPQKNSTSGSSTSEVRRTGVTATFSGATSSRVLGVVTPGAVNEQLGDYKSVIYKGDEFILKEGEGIAMYQEANNGDALVAHKFLIEWQETSTNTPQTISFNLSTSTVYFGTLISSQTSYASSTSGGGDSNEVEAHRFTALTSATNGYTITVKGQTLSYGNYSIDRIGSTPASPVTGTEQFGMRLTAAEGSGAVLSPYNSAQYAYNASSTAYSPIASSSIGDNATTTYEVYYMANINALTEAAPYSASLVYTITANF